MVTYVLSHSVSPSFCDSMYSSPPGPSFHGDSPGKNTGVGCHFLLQEPIREQEYGQNKKEAMLSPKSSEIIETIWNNLKQSSSLGSSLRNFWWKGCEIQIELLSSRSSISTSWGAFVFFFDLGCGSLVLVGLGGASTEQRKRGSIKELEWIQAASPQLLGPSLTFHGCFLFLGKSDLLEEFSALLPRQSNVGTCTGSEPKQPTQWFWLPERSLDLS